MKFLPLCVGVLLVSAFPALADDDLPHVSVFGTAVTQVEPDLLRWSIGIENRGAEIELVASEHTNTVALTLRFLREQKIPSERIQTSQMSLSEHREYRNNSWIMEGYDASTTVSFVTSDLPSYRAIWHGLSKIKGISVNGAHWDTSKRIELRDATRVDALKAAKAKAETMAATLGMKLAEPLMIEEPVNFIQGDLHGNRLQSVTSTPGEDGESVAPGAIEIRIRVRVSFRIVAQ
ncbi:MAG TPA: SIMPL domain-containing protein [Opitutaceae bacterium]|nr:SIMPL domain-containing protein [Opitutaceae bacterium]